MLAHYRRTLRRKADLIAIATVLAVTSVAFSQREAAQATASAQLAGFPSELVDWVPGGRNPVFTAGGAGQWDAKIRERGWILRDDDGYHLWYTGYDGTREGIKLLGYASSSDGLHWTRSDKNPLIRDHWVEDMMVVHEGDTYFMFAEGKVDNHAELLISSDCIQWQCQGPLDVRLADGTHQAKKPCGTPTVWLENGTWYLFYEWLDRGVWLAESKDPLSKIWINVQDEPVLVPGPTEYDQDQIAVDQIIQHDGEYFALYHGSGGGAPRIWNTNIARSNDLIHWQKYAGNPIIDDNKSSGIVLNEGNGFRLYTMHEQVDVFFSRAK